MSTRHFMKPWAAPKASFLALLAGLMFFGCMAGTGTDTENGIQVTARVVNANGDPMAQVEVNVRSLTSRPDQASVDPVVNSGTLRTDENGFVSFEVRKAGSYMAQAQRSDTVLLLDTLIARDRDTTVLRTGPVTRIKGKLRLYSGYRIDTGFAFVRGSSVTARITRTGDYDFGYLPLTATTLAMGIEYAARPVGNVSVKLSDGTGGKLIVDSRFSLDSSLVPNGGLPSLTLFKASGSETDVCLEDDQQTVVPGISLKGSLGKAMDVRRGAGYACDTSVGAVVKVYETDDAGKNESKLGDFVLPDMAIWPQVRGMGSSVKGLKMVIPLECLKSGASANYLTHVVQDAGNIEIRVDDLGVDVNCGY